jgi:hypothetical protein
MGGGKMENRLGISNDSKVAQVVAYLDQEFSSYEFIDELKQFIIDQAIDGATFLSLTDNELKSAGMVALGKRKTIMTLVYRASAGNRDAHLVRLKRWDDLNYILAESRRKKGKTYMSTPYSSVSWDLVGPIFENAIERYYQVIRNIPEEDLQALSKSLKWIIKSYKSQIFTGNESKRLHLIAPVIWSVAQLLPDVIVKTEEDLAGVRVDAHGHFEFTLFRGQIRICIIEAKKEDFEQGMAQDLLGCEVAADLDNSSTVYGVVTNFEKWIFIKSCDSKIFCDESNVLTFDENDYPIETQLASVAGKLYALLYGD